MSKAYKAVVAVADRFVPNKLRPLWEHEAGPKTIFFWAPAFKWRIDGKRTNLYSLSPKSGQFTVEVDKGAYLVYSEKGLVLAGLGDLNRPVETLSIPQSASLAATGLIWSRYSLVIIPKNYSLFAVNVFVAATSLYQIGRAFKHQQASKNTEK